MSLYRFELRKLLCNKKTISLLAGLFVLYSLIGLVTSMFLIGSRESYRFYEELAADYEGSFDAGKAAWAKKEYEEISARYGTDSRMIARSIKDQPETMLALKYNEFVGRVDEYWNGTPPESMEEPYGIALLESMLSELEMQGKQNTFAYTKFSGSLKVLTALGEPEFANILLWENLFVNWGGTFDAVSAVYSAGVYHCPGICRGKGNGHGSSDFKFPERQTENYHSKTAQYSYNVCRCRCIVCDCHVYFWLSASCQPAWLGCRNTIHSDICSFYVWIQGLAACCYCSGVVDFHRGSLQCYRWICFFADEKPEEQRRGEPRYFVYQCGTGGDGGWRHTEDTTAYRLWAGKCHIDQRSVWKFQSF